MTKSEVTEYLKKIMAGTEQGQEKAAQVLGLTMSAFCNRLRRNSISAADFATICEALGYEITITKNDEPIRKGRRTESPRVNVMVDGRRYDTNKADSVCHTYKSMGLYDELFQRDDDGSYFLVHYEAWEHGVQNGENTVSPISDEDAYRLMELWIL